MSSINPELFDGSKGSTAVVMEDLAQLVANEHW
jgi:hypothetical protein